MNELKQLLFSEIEEFRQKGHKFIDKELTVAQFKGISGGMGVYAHRGGKEFMIRFRIPSGVTSVSNLKLVSSLAEKYNLDGIHFTTRQAIQLHGLNIDEICDLMKEALENDIYTRGSGGNFPRNVAISPLSGVQRGEAFDVTPYALIANEHFLKKINTYHLPRKLKVSFSNSDEDTANCTVQDLGFVATIKDGIEYFRVFVGGGLGTNPRKGFELDELINPNEILYYIEGITNLFINEGDYENKNKARIRYIAERLGREEFLAKFKEYVNIEKEKNILKFHLEKITIDKKGEKTNRVDSRLISQKQEGLYSVYLHSIGGNISLEAIRSIMEVLEQYKNIDIRLSMSEGVYFRNLNGIEAEKILNLTENIGGNTKIEQSVSCIGVPTCQVGIAQSQGLLNNIIKYFKERNYKSDILPKVNISGCINSCGVHEIGKIGFTGKKKKVLDEVKEVFSLSLGGATEVSKVNIGENRGEILAAKIPEFLYELAETIEKSGLDFDAFIEKESEKLQVVIDKYLV